MASEKTCSWREDENAICKENKRGCPKLSFWSLDSSFTSYRDEESQGWEAFSDILMRDFLPITLSVGQWRKEVNIGSNCQSSYFVIVSD